MTRSALLESGRPGDTNAEAPLAPNENHTDTAEWQRAAAENRRPVPSDRVVQGTSRRVYRVLVVFWVVANVVFWSQWFRWDNVATPWLYAIFTAALGYDATFLPTVYLFFLGRMRRPRPIVAPPGLKVALITLCVPSEESLEVIGEQLTALVRVRYPHDSWILDEGNDPAVQAMAARLGVRYFTRAGIARYNQPLPPFRAKTKAGNVNAWLDTWGKDYEFFVQYDIDHHPIPEYLDRVLGYFADQSVGWVQAPSVYRNFETWIGRGAAEQELVLQGPLQEGFFGTTETPFIIGSHCTYRMSAIREIGGFQPTRAEDHLDTVVLAMHQYRGVFVPEEIAVGDGPETFETYLRQQFAWAYSMTQVLISYAPRYLGELRWSQTLQFLFAQTWYPLWSASMLILYLTPAVVLLTGLRPTKIDFYVFVVAILPLNVVSFAIYLWSRRWQMPAGLRLSWRGVILHVARWPIVSWALVNVILRISHPYMITPKGKGAGSSRMLLMSQIPYLGLALLNVVVSWLYTLRNECAECRSYVLFASLGGVWMLVVVAINMWVSASDRPSFVARLAPLAHVRSVPIAAAVTAIVVLQMSLVASYPMETLFRSYPDVETSIIDARITSSVGVPVDGNPYIYERHR